MAVTELQVKVTIAKILQLAYDSDGETTAAIVYSGSHYSISVDQTGQVKLVGTVADIVVFNGDPVLKGLGLKLRRASVNFRNGSGGTFEYTGSFDFTVGSSISVSGSVDVFELIKSCSGLLCQAARFLSGRDAQIEHELQQYIR